MKSPCVYINKANFVVTGAPAPPNFGLYLLYPNEQREMAILHELAHVAGVIQFDGDEKGDLKGTKSLANTSCIRANCVPCTELTKFKACPGVPDSARKHGQRPGNTNSRGNVAAPRRLPRH